MKRKIIAILSIAIAVLSIFAVASMVNAGGGNAGTVYTNDNASPNNNVLYYYRASDGSLTYGGSVATGGMGTGSALASQGAVVLTNNGRFLLTVDAGERLILGVRHFEARSSNMGNSFFFFFFFFFVPCCRRAPTFISNYLSITAVGPSPLSQLLISCSEGQWARPSQTSYIDFNQPFHMLVLQC